MNIVMIDSGVDKKHKVFKNVNIINYVYNNNKTCWEISDNYIAQNGHGTAIASIISRNVVEPINIFSFVVFNNKLECDDDLLVNCLNFIHDNIECDLINMSLGTIRFNMELYRACKTLSEKSIIISAFSNDGCISYPAAYEFVIGVDASFRCNSDDFVFVSNSVINVKAKGFNQRVAWLNNQYVITNGASYACGYVTNFVMKQINKGVRKRDEILHQIYKSSIYKYENEPLSFNLEKIKYSNIAVFLYIPLRQPHLHGKIAAVARSNRIKY